MAMPDRHKSRKLRNTAFVTSNSMMAMRLARALAAAQRHSSIMSNAHPLPQLGCTVYISEGHDETFISKLKAVASSEPNAHLVNTFIDKPYHRSSFTLVSGTPSALANAAVRIAVEALEGLDLRSHTATHPRLGVADHISCHPLNDAAALKDAAALAKTIAEQLATGPHELPVYLYGSASDSNKSLADIRRQLGYFQHDGNSMWQGSLGYADLSQCPPDMGPSRAQLKHGVMTVGAIPWIINFNVPLHTSDITKARMVARAVSERGGGLKHVEAMALQHAGVVEVACNLLDYKTSGPVEVQAAVNDVAAQHGIAASEGYCIGKLPEHMVELALMSAAKQ